MRSIIPNLEDHVKFTVFILLAKYFKMSILFMQCRFTDIADAWSGSIVCSPPSSVFRLPSSVFFHLNRQYHQDQWLQRLKSDMSTRFEAKLSYQSQNIEIMQGLFKFSAVSIKQVDPYLTLLMSDSIDGTRLFTSYNLGSL